MTIWVDADACPVVIRDILFKAANRTKTRLVLIANQSIQTPASSFIQSLRVSSGYDEADKEIVRRVQVGDLVITSDIPLAADVIEKGGQVITSRGEKYTLENIRSRLNMRDFMESMRASGVQGGGPPPLSQSDKQSFANQLDRYLASTQKLNQES